MNLPVIVECNAWTLPQERYNAEFVREKQVGLVLPSFRRIAPAVAELLRGDKLCRLRQNAVLLNNQAVFEIPKMLETILEGRSNGQRIAGPKVS